MIFSFRASENRRWSRSRRFTGKTVRSSSNLWNQGNSHSWMESGWRNDHQFHFVSCLEYIHILHLLSLKISCKIIHYAWTLLFRPKKDNITALDDYRRAETIGEEQGDCWSFYPACPFSIFNIIPDIYTKDDQVRNMVIGCIIYVPLYNISSDSNLLSYFII